MSKQDLTQYSDNELSLLVFNDEGLYKQRHRSYFIDDIKEFFIFTDEQLEVLQQDLQDELDEENKEDSEEDDVKIPWIK